ncbi:MAG: hypothetical protein JWM88_1937 [Verrucomicrobia bacterium]|nr:hypothetical protein [Verrucomicrobiota bacterium]
MLCVALLSGCTITEHVRPVTRGTEIKKIYVQNNHELHMKGLVPEVVSQLELLGYQAETYEAKPPADAKYFMTVTANWRWDMAMYLFYFRVMLFEDGRAIGTAEYDARRGGGNVSKFGPTAEKIRPLLEQMLHDATRPPRSTSLGQP